MCYSSDGYGGWSTVGCVTIAEVLFSGIGIPSLTLSKASSNLQTKNNIVLKFTEQSVYYLRHAIARTWLSCLHWFDFLEALPVLL